MLNISKASIEDIKPQTQDLIRQWRNQESIRMMMFNQDIITKESHDKWIISLNDNPEKIVKIFLYDKIPMGVITFTKVHQELFEWGFYIGNQNAPRGMGKLLGIMALDYYFSKINSHKLFAEVLSYNEKSLAFHQKLGFISEGILRQHYKKQEEFYDVHLLGILKNEWLDTRVALLNHLKGENNE